MVYFISDTHFYHNNIIKYCNRPFSNVEEMNRVMIDKWNSIVKDEDTVYHLGDFCLSSDDNLRDIFFKLNGNIILIRGNHDRKPARYYEDIGFTVLKNAPIKLEEYKLMLSHVPVPISKVPSGYINLHGHIHNKKISDEYPNDIYPPDKYINVSVDVTDFEPISIDKIRKRVNK